MVLRCTGRSGRGEYVDTDELQMKGDCLPMFYLVVLEPLADNPAYSDTASYMFV